MSMSHGIWEHTPNAIMNIKLNENKISLIMKSKYMYIFVIFQYWK